MIWFTTDPTDAWYGQVGDNGQHYVQSGTYSYRVEVNSLSEEDVRKEVRACQCDSMMQSHHSAGHQSLRYEKGIRDGCPF